MNAEVEARIRAAIRAEAETLREVRPLRLPPPGARPRRIRLWIAPAAAAAAVIALAVSLVLVRDIPNGRVVPPAPAPISPGAVPEYYVALPGADNFANVPGAPTAVVGDTLSGRHLLTIRPSGNDKFVSVSAAADDRTFALGAAPDLSPPAVPSATDWYLVRLLPGRVPRAAVRKLSVLAPPSGRADTTALSPDGSELAVLGTQPGPNRSSLEFLRVYSVATGKLLRSWSGPLDVAFDAYSTLSWTADGKRLWFGYTSGVLKVRMLDVTRPGQDLLAGSQLVWSATTSSPGRAGALSCAQAQRVVVTPDGTVVCGGSATLRPHRQAVIGGPVCPANPPWNSLGFPEYSTVTGKLVRTAYQANSNCLWPEDDVLWASASGEKVIGYLQYGQPGFTQTTIVRFGIFADGRFTPLPDPPTITTTPNAIAW